MKRYNIDQNSDEWLDIRKGKVTGSKLKGIAPKKRGSGKKIGFYELMAERLSVIEEPEDPMERGSRLEEDAIIAFEQETGKSVERGGFCVADFNENIALSPDGLIDNGGKYTEAVEVKCLSAARHLEAYFTKEIPSDYTEQVLQYFIVNEDLQTLYFVFYDPRLKAIPMFHFEVKRVDKKEEIEEYKLYQEEELAEIDRMLESLLF